MLLGSDEIDSHSEASDHSLYFTDILAVRVSVTTASTLSKNKELRHPLPMWID